MEMGCFPGQFEVADGPLKMIGLTIGYRAESCRNCAAQCARDDVERRDALRWLLNYEMNAEVG